MMSPSDRLAEATKALDDAEAEVRKRRIAWVKALLHARNAGVTRDSMVHVTRRSRARINQILKPLIHEE